MSSGVPQADGVMKEEPTMDAKDVARSAAPIITHASTTCATHESTVAIVVACAASFPCVPIAARRCLGLTAAAARRQGVRVHG